MVGAGGFAIQPPAVRIPAVVVEALDPREGDEIEISIAGKRDFKVARDRSKERAIEQLRQMKWSFPPNFKFNREVGWVPLSISKLFGWHCR